ncbi:hypothetical protein [Barnesiella sp. An22]|uniref:hypothetical protein n=1 Tax=Barnesiella sp. An22 TaxID=1965590 RepID=UPI00117826D2|nr:hypothetical protein [Barnesiella sp. An22]
MLAQFAWPSRILSSGKIVKGERQAKMLAQFAWPSRIVSSHQAKIRTFAIRDSARFYPLYFFVKQFIKAKIFGAQTNKNPNTLLSLYSHIKNDKDYERS